MALHTQNGLALCAGVGGLELGLHIAEPNYRTVCYVEQETHAAATIVARMEDKALDQAPIWSDLKTFDPEPWIGKVSILSAGYPCQPFSVLGKRKGTDDPRHLWPYIAKITEKIRPEWLFLENVQGHLDIGFNEVIRSLQELDFAVEAGVFTAFEVGASHERRRLFIVAHSNRCGERQSSRSSLGEERSHNEKAGNLQAQHKHCSSVVDVNEINKSGTEDLFAPSPGDLKAWQELLRRNPDYEPGVWRNANGMAEGMDRSKSVGNGVCSLAAAYAWRTLKARFKDT